MPETPARPSRYRPHVPRMLARLLPSRSPTARWPRRHRQRPTDPSPARYQPRRVTSGTRLDRGRPADPRRCPDVRGSTDRLTRGCVLASWCWTPMRPMSEETSASPVSLLLFGVRLDITAVDAEQCPALRFGQSTVVPDSI